MHTPYKNLLTLLSIVLLVEQEVSGDVLFQKGWFKPNKKDTKRVLSNVSCIDSRIVPDTKYLRIRAEIPHLFRGGIGRLENVETLKLTSCDISDIDPGAFELLPKLATLALQDNAIERIRVGVFSRLTLSKLYLHRNQIQVIETQAFDDMPNLYLLKLNSNSISSWDGNWFKNTPRLTDLFFRRNELRSIPSEAFKNVKASYSGSGTKSMGIKIYLSKNHISSIDPNAFLGHKELSQLWLDRNELKEVDEKLFSHLDRIEVISFGKNSLKSLPGNLLSNLKTDLLILDLASNNNVTCLDYEIVSRVKMTNLQRISKLDCKCVWGLLERLTESGKDYEISSDCKIGD